MDTMEVKVPIHRHAMTPLKENRMGNCCGIQFEGISDGYYCAECDEFFHKACSNAPFEVNHPFPHPRCCKVLFMIKSSDSAICGLCREDIRNIASCYKCYTCGMIFHLECGRCPPAEVIEVPQNHNHKLKLEKVKSCFTCAACGRDGDGYSYKCHECDLTFHVNCVKYGAEVNHPSHSFHPLKLVKGKPPAYTDGKCRLCGKKILDETFYHCSTCNFTLDLQCVFSPPPLYHHELNIHDHQLTLMPKSISFTCTICGLNGDRSPYVCLPCDFTAHNDCSGFPWVININRHDHRVSRTSLLGVVNSKCGVCQKKLDWSCGGYSCLRCPSSVFHTKCATRKDVSEGIEMKDEPDEDEDIQAFEVVDENTIRHILHDPRHNLRLDTSGIIIKERSCMACAYPIYHHSFYSCIECKFLIHETCANLPKRKWHMVSSTPFELCNMRTESRNCDACDVLYNGSTYRARRYCERLDMRCASVTEPFVHKSHLHPLFYTSPRGVCSVCNKESHHVLRCVEDDCGYVMDFECALLPYEVKHRVDDHFLSLCYGEEDASGKYWCDICEKETNPKTWFYTCKDCGVALHTDCVLGDSRGLCPGSQVLYYRSELTDRSFEVVRNNSMSRPNCSECKSRCIFPLILKHLKKIGNDYYCSVKCSAIEQWD